MDLYDLIPFELSGSGIIAIPPSALALAPFTIGPGLQHAFRMMQIAQTQDFSMRVWISDVSEGAPYLMSGYWPMLRAVETLTVYDQTLTAPVGRSVAVTPGSYFLMVLNLCNQKNGFAFAVDQAVV